MAIVGTNENAVVPEVRTKYGDNVHTPYLVVKEPHRRHSILTSTCDQLDRASPLAVQPTLAELSAVDATGAICEPQRIEVFNIFGEGLLDTVCGHDMVGEAYARIVMSYCIAASPEKFQTANGVTSTSKACPMVVNALDNSVVDPYVMKSSSALLSIRFH